MPTNNKPRSRDEIRRSIDTEHRYHNQTVAGIRSDANLSEQGKRSQFAQEQTRHSAAIATLKAEDDAAADVAQTEALRSLWGLKLSYAMSDADKIAAGVSYRDAIARASSMDAKQAARAFQLAAVAGDQELRRAIALVAHTEGWSDLAEAWAQEDSSRLETYQALVEMQSPKSATQKLADKINFSASPAPKELGHIGANVNLTVPATDGGNGGARGSGNTGNTGSGQGSGAQ